MPPKRRRKLHGLYYHTSPPKVLPMNGISGGGTKHDGTAKEAFVVKPSSIRIWIHERDVGKLTRVLWTGQANRLRREVSTHPKVRKFLQMVPYIMNNIRDIHQNAVENDAGSLQANLEPPVPPSIVTAKDQNGLTIVHKAAGLGHSTIVQTILDIWPDGVNDTDGTGKTPLHWAASAKNNSYCYNLLVSAGADEDALDFKMKTPAYYKNKQHDIDRSLLTVLPDAPRVSQEIKTDWSAIVDEIGNLNSENNNNASPKKSNKIIGNGVNVLTSRSKANSLEDPLEAEDLDNGDEKLTPEEQELLAAIDDPNFYRQLEEEEKARAAKAEEHDEHKDDEENVDGVGVGVDADVVGVDDINDNKDDVDDDDDDDDDDKTTADDDKDVNEKSVHDDDDLNANDDDDEKTQQDNGNDDDATANNDQNGNHVDEDNAKVDSANDGQEHNDEHIHDEEHSDSGGNIENGEHDSVMGSPRKDDSNDSVNGSPKKEADVGAVKAEDGKPDDDKPEDTIPVVDEPKNVTIPVDEPKNDTIPVDEPKFVAVSVGKSKTDTQDHSNAASEPLVESQKVEAAQATNEEDKKKEEVKDEEEGQHEEEGDKPTEEDHGTEDVVKNGLDDVDAGGNVNAPNGHHTEEGEEEEESEVAKQETVSNHSGEDGKSQHDGHENDEATSEMNGNGDVGKDEEENKAEIEDNSSVKSMKSNGENHEDSDKKNDKSDDIISNNQIITDNNIKSNHHKDDEETKSEEDDDDDEQDVNGEVSKIDKNHNRVTKGETSPSPAMEIEGIVQGEPDNNQVQSQSGGFDVDEKSQMQSIIDAGDMEQLAAIVLNGEGKKLIGAESKQPEIQAFLNNVSAYMNKIKRVHMAAREGSLRDLQAALDRRKFAIAKDEISPKGASPLHVATIFGHASIVRYLGGRFPETTSAVDDDGRTALHYAAVIKDNGHFYNLLSHLGSNPKAVDKLGHTAEFYTNHEQSENILSHSQLLKSYGVKEDIQEEMLSDQDRNKDSTPDVQLFQTEQGQYLARALGDPLIKGLTEVVERRPEDPVGFLATYLQNLTRLESQPQKQQQQQQSQPQYKSQPPTAAKPVLADTRQAQSYSSQSTALQNKPSHSEENEEPSSPEGSDSTIINEERDDHGQSMLHFACARAHGRNALFNLIEESDINITYRDELYRTARDVSLQASQPANAKEIDRYVLSLAAKGDLKMFHHLVAEGYDHILDVTDEDGKTIIDVAKSRGHNDVANFLRTIQSFEIIREELHQAIRTGNVEKVQDLVATNDGARLAKVKNYYGRCALHIAVLKENEEIVELLANRFKQALRIGDNLERTPLHYAMGINAVETISRILIKNGAKRIRKDLKGRQPSYYFMNKADILRLQEEEEEDQ